MAKKAEYINLVSPLVKARYPKLDKQDVYDGKEVGYKLGMLPADDAEWAKFKDAVEAAATGLMKAAGKKNLKFSPIREKDDVEYIEAKSYNLVPLFGAKGGVKLPESTREKIGGGSLVRVKLSLTFSNGGVTAYMNGVQVAKMVEKGTGGFEDIDGFDDAPQGDDSGFSDVDVDGDDGLDI